MKLNDLDMSSEEKKKRGSWSAHMHALKIISTGQNKYCKLHILDSNKSVHPPAGQKAGAI